MPGLVHHSWVYFRFLGFRVQRLGESPPLGPGDMEDSVSSSAGLGYCPGSLNHTPGNLEESIVLVFGVLVSGAAVGRTQASERE